MENRTHARFPTVGLAIMHEMWCCPKREDAGGESRCTLYKFGREYYTSCHANKMLQRTHLYWGCNKADIAQQIPLFVRKI